ncbi:MAG: ribose-5-phosphate isomerase [Phycisphaerae bacterium]|nr:ribose-5-phosphate isomerase [Phycisphaerae bacterium]
MKVVAIAADHAGWPLLETAETAARENGWTPVRLGADLADPKDDYPDFAELVARAVQSGEAARGILVCGSGVGAAVAACKFKGVRASVCHDTYSAGQGVDHDDLNVLCVGARIIGTSLARAVMDAFLTASFSDEPRHHRRLEKVNAFEGA